MKKSVQLQHGIRVRVGGAPAECAPTAAFARVDAIVRAFAVVGLARTSGRRVAATDAVGARLGPLLYNSRRRVALALSLVCGAIVQWALADAEEGVVRAFLSPDVAAHRPAAHAPGYEPHRGALPLSRAAATSAPP